MIRMRALQLGAARGGMDAGYLVQVDTPEHLLANPHTLQAARLTASPALNELTLTEGQHLPAGASLYVRATSLQRLILIMRHVQPREPVFGVQTRNIRPNTCAQFLINTRQRLIEKNHRCFADEGARNTHTLRLPPESSWGLRC